MDRTLSLYFSSSCLRFPSARTTGMHDSTWLVHSSYLSYFWDRDSLCCPGWLLTCANASVQLCECWDYWKLPCPAILLSKHGRQEEHMPQASILQFCLILSFPKPFISLCTEFQLLLRCTVRDINTLNAIHHVTASYSSHPRPISLVLLRQSAVLCQHQHQHAQDISSPMSGRNNCTYLCKLHTKTYGWSPSAASHLKTKRLCSRRIPQKHANKTISSLSQRVLHRNVSVVWLQR